MTQNLAQAHNIGWRAVSLGDVSELLTGFPFKSQNYSNDTNDPRLLGGDNIVQATLRWDNTRRWPISLVKNLDSYWLQPDDVVLAMDRPWIEAGLKYSSIRSGDLPLLLVQRTARLRGGVDLDTRYLAYVIGSPDFTQYILEVQTGTAVPHISPGQIRSYKFMLPPRSEQQGIAKILSSLDDRIALLRETNATLEAIAQALFKSWFVDFDPVRAKAEGRSPEGMDEAIAALFPDGFEQSALGEFPAGWAVGKVEDVLTLHYGKALKSTDRSPGQVPVYGSGGVTGFHNTSLVDVPSVIVGRKGTVGSLYWESRPFFPIDTVFYVEPKRSLAYTYYMLKTLGLEDMNTDGAIPGLNRGNVYRLQVFIPESRVLAAFDEVVGRIRHKIQSNQDLALTLTELRDTLLPRLISGQLRLPQAEALAAEAGL